MNREQQRLDKAKSGEEDWRLWGPYLSERQWGTVREDYSNNGDAWNYFSHDQARSRAYRWGEDGLAGLCDSHQILCFAVAIWNGKDPILKERLFGLTGKQGNHGEDVKESYFYLDASPSHAYLKMLYKYPLVSYPYEELLTKNPRSRTAPEFEIYDTGVFNESNYVDLFVEYAKADIDDILIRITAVNRSSQAAEIRLLPQLWFRNTWSWGDAVPKPAIRQESAISVLASNKRIGDYRWWIESDATKFLFTENDTNPSALFGSALDSGFYKDAFHRYVVNGESAAVNPEQSGTKCAADYALNLEPNQPQSIRLRLKKVTDADAHDPFSEFDRIFVDRIAETDEFYNQLQCDFACKDSRDIQRQAFAGLIWTKQFYRYTVKRWLEGDPTQPEPAPQRWNVRNADWTHVNNSDVISMPDKWEYPWYAAWDLAFHCVPFALIDAEFAKEQMLIMLREWYMHPNGQIPAYEWNFSDVNPPVHAWGTWRIYQIDRKRSGKADRDFLERSFHKLMLNFTWWVNRKDVDNRNVFQGGFLGLDNIGVFDRSHPLPGGGRLDQADGTSWVAMFSLNMMRIALELALENKVYEDIASKFFEHFLQIAEAIQDIGGSGNGLWNEEDKFFYDVLHAPTGEVLPLKVRSLVGLTPLFAVEVLEPELLRKVPDFTKRLQWVLDNKPELAKLVSRWHEPGRGERRLLSLLRGSRMKSLLRRMLDESEFLSEYGVRSLSKYHQSHPYILRDEHTTIPLGCEELTVNYQPGESETNLFGGNSNWRGPVWFPMNYLIIESLQKFHHYYGDDFRIECPVGSSVMVSINEAADEIRQRLARIFLKDATGQRAVFGDCHLFRSDPHFREHILFYEYFHAEDGHGLGASHQTGWTALIAKILQPRFLES